MIPLIRTSQTIDLVCSADPAVHGLADGGLVWRPAASTRHDPGATVATCRPLSAEEMFRVRQASAGVEHVSHEAMGLEACKLGVVRLSHGVVAELPYFVAVSLGIEIVGLSTAPPDPNAPIASES